MVFNQLLIIRLMHDAGFKSDVGLHKKVVLAHACSGDGSSANNFIESKTKNNVQKLHKLLLKTYFCMLFFFWGRS